MLAASVINSDFTLNAFQVLGALEFIPGEAITLALQLYQPQRSDHLRYVAPSTAMLDIYLPNKDGTILEKAATVLAADKSIWSVDLTALETADLSGGNFTFDLDLLGDGTKILKGFVQNGLSIIITGVC